MKQDGIKRASIDKLKSRFETAYYSEDMVITPLVMFRELDDITALIQGVSIGVTVSGSAKIKINGKMHEIGIMKALGTKNTSIGVVFGLQVGLIALLTCILSTVGYYFFIDMANEILIGSIRQIAPEHTLPDLQFLIFKPEIAVMNCLLVFALAFVSFLLPMIKIKAIKPVKIIKAKE